MDICNVTKLPCAYCNPVCSSRIEKESCAGCIRWCVRLYDSKMCCYNPDSEYYYEVYNGGCKLHSKRKDDYMKEKKFECGYCGKEYDMPLLRGQCELECHKKCVAEKERLHKEKLMKEKAERREEIVSQSNCLADKLKQYQSDYNEPVALIGRDNVDIDTLFWLLSSFDNGFTLYK